MPRRLVALAREALRLALLTEIPAPYRIPLFNALSERVDLRVLFLAERDPRRGFYELHRDEWRFDHRVLRGAQLRRGGRWLVLNRGVAARAAPLPPRRGRRRRLEPAGLLARARLLPGCGASRCSSGSSPPPATPARRRARSRSPGPRWCAAPPAPTSPGRAAAEYARSLGVELVETAPNAIDASIFERAAVDRSGRDGCTFLYVGRLDPEKGLDTLLEAFRDVPGELVLVGGGGDEQRLRGLAGDRVRFEGPRRPRRARRLLPRRRRLRSAVALRAVGHGPERGRRRGAAARRDRGVRCRARPDRGRRQRLPRPGRRRPGPARPRCGGSPTIPSCGRAHGARSRELAARFTPEAWAEGVARLARATTIGDR